jgi:dihydrofolate reductase
MAELTLTAFLSLDGVMQAPGAPDEDKEGDFRYGGWVFPHADADMGAIMDDIFSKADAFLLGRTTYDIFAAHWPRVQDNNDPIANKLNTLPKHVASRKRTSFDWHDSSLVGDVVDGVAALKKRYSREIQVHGSIGLAQTLIENDLIDEYRLLIFPVVLGQGKRLFGSGARPATLALQQCSTTRSGIVYCVYRRAGALKTGSFALE